MTANDSQQPAPRLAETVARRIEQEIVDRGWPVGTMLGSEAELIERMGVGRAVFREAIRIVEHHNVARMRRGPGGGLVVTEPDTDAVVRAIELYLGFAEVSDDQLSETRAALELLSVRQAAARIDTAGIARLRAVLATERSRREEAITSEHPVDLHQVLAELTGNPAIALFVSVLAELTRVRSVRSVLDLEDELAGYHRAHELIAEAVIAGDASLAQHYMRRHLHYVARVAASLPTGADLPLPD